MHVEFLGIPRERAGVAEIDVEAVVTRLVAAGEQVRDALQRLVGSLCDQARVPSAAPA